MSTQHHKHISAKNPQAKSRRTRKLHPTTSHSNQRISHRRIASHAFSTTTTPPTTTDTTATPPPPTTPPTMPTPILAPIHADTTHEFSSEKTITTTPEVFQYLERFGRRHYPLVQQLRKDTLVKRQETIRFLLEPTTCSLLEQQLRLSAGVRVLEVGVFTGVTSLALAHNVVANYNKVAAKQQQKAPQQTAQQQQNAQHQPLDTTSLPNHISGLAAQLSEEQKHNITVKRREYNVVKRNFLKFKQNLSTDLDDNDNDDIHSVEDQHTPITDLDVMFYDTDATIRQLRAQQQQWNENNTQHNNNTSQPTTTTTTPPPPPLVIGLDLDNHTFQEVALPVFQEANMMGTPYVFLSGSALETFEKLMGSEDHTEGLPHNITSANPKPQQITNNNPFKGTFDLIFIDADKNNYLNYYEYCLELIKPETGLICIDNVLWKGGVVPYGEKSEINKNNNDTTTAEHQQQQQQDIETHDDKKLRKKREQQNKKRVAAGKEPIVYPLTKKPKRDVAEILHEFNAFIYNDPRVDALTLPLGDGLTIVRKLL